MYPIKRLLVGFDQSEHDEVLIKYCAFLGHKLNIDKIYFLHIAKSLELPEEILDKYPDLIAPVDENIRHELMQTIDFHFPDKLKEKTEVIILEGSPESSFLREIKIKEIDLMIMGHKSSKNSTGYLPKKMARLAHCSISLVAENTFEIDEAPKKILVSVDFSKNSETALEFSQVVAEKNENIDIYYQHVYSVPSGYSKTGKTLEEFAEVMLENAKRKMNAQLKKNRLSLPDDKIIYTFSQDHNVAESIRKYAENNDIVAIIIGSKGRTDTASFFLGSTAEKLVANFKKSLIIVKDKRHNMDFMEVLLKI